MQIIFSFLVMALVSAVAGSIAPSMLGDVTTSILGNQVRVDRVVMLVTVVGSLGCSAIAAVAAVAEVCDRATKRRLFVGANR